MDTSNEYLNQVVQEQAQVEGELRNIGRKAKARPARAAAFPSGGSSVDLDEEFADLRRAPGRPRASVRAVDR